MPYPYRFWPFLVPLAWCAVVLAIMRPGAISVRDPIPYEVKWLLTDPNDLTALAIRGANAADGRLPGRSDEPGWNDPEILARLLDGPSPPLSERFYLEYPLPALGIFRAAYPSPPELPSVVADGFQYGVGQFVPRTSAERDAWSSLGMAVRCYLVTSTLCLAALIVILGRGYHPGEPWNRLVWLAVLPGSVFFTLHRFDIYPTLCTALAFAALGRRRVAWAGAFLAVGVLLKLYPVLLAPVLFRYLGWRDGTKFSVAFGLTLVAGFVVAWALTDWTSLVGPIRVQLNRGIEAGGTMYGKLLPLWLARHGGVRLTLIAGVVFACLATKPSDLESVLRRCGIILVTFVVLAVFWSPQWMLWFLPILIPLAVRSRVFRIAAILLDTVHYLSFPLLLWVVSPRMSPEVGEAITLTATLVRSAVWIGLAGLFVFVRSADPGRDFLRSLSRRLAEVVETGNRSGLPRGLKWMACERNGEILFPTDSPGRALAPFLITFEPVPGSDMEDVPAARIPRPVTCVFRYVNGSWTLDRPPVFNLSPEQVRARLT